MRSKAKGDITMKFLSYLYDMYKETKQKKTYKAEMKICKEGNGPAPHLYKEELLKDYAVKYKCSALIETGTFLGDMVASQLLNFRNIASIEISKELYEKAVERFKNHSWVYLYLGDSAHKLSDVIDDINKKTTVGKILFWLDGHWSAGNTGRGDKDTPVLEELNVIFEKLETAIILIDDARCFINEGIFIEYPTLKELKEYVLEKKPTANIDINMDIIRIVY